MSVWKRYKKKIVKPGETDYNKGVWQAEGSHENVRYKKSLPLAITKRDAEKYELEIKRQISAGEYEVAKKRTTYADYVNKTYLPRIKTENPSWENNKKYEISRLLKYFGDYPLKLITRVLCEKYRDKRKKDTISCQRCHKFKEHCYMCFGENARYKNPCWKCKKRIQLFKIHKSACKPKTVEPSTVNRDLMTHSAILSGAVIDREITENPMRFVSTLKESEPSDRILTPKEKQKLFVLLNAKDISPARHRLRGIIFIALTTGWREGRIMAINKEDLDRENQSVVVVRSKQDESKKVRVASLTWEILTDFASRVPHGRIFRNLSDGSPLKHFPDDDWRELLKDAKIKDLTFHNLRATVGTEMILSGASSFEAQQALGHKRVTTTERYIRIASKILADNLEKQGEKYREFME